MNTPKQVRAMHSTPTARAALESRPLFITGLVAALAAGGMVGCSTDSSSAYNYRSGALTRDQLANKATLTIDPSETKGSVDKQWFEEQASTIELPAVWLSEARNATADIEGRRAAAQAYKAERNAVQANELAHRESAWQNAVASHDAAIAKAGALDRQYEAKLEELSAQAIAKQEAYDAQARQGAAVVRATLKERQAEFERMRSVADTELRASEAEYQKMLAARVAVERQGSAEIE
ncbi:MAG: hypothetical protein ACTS27_06270, partial [Phycisphaerales bacterium]